MVRYGPDGELCWNILTLKERFLPFGPELFGPLEYFDYCREVFDEEALFIMAETNSGITRKDLLDMTFTNYEELLDMLVRNADEKRRQQEADNR